MITDLFQAHPASSSHTYTDRLFQASDSLLSLFSGRTAVSAKSLQETMTRCFAGTDASGAWQWKDAYEALEIAQIRFVRKYADTLRGMKPEIVLTLLENLQALCPTQTKRSEESQKLQQFSTPLGLGYIAAQACGIGSEDTVLEPSAGTGMLAVMACLRGATPVLNELAESRAAILSRLFPHSPPSSHNAEYLADYLDRSYPPSVVVMNPPFSSSPNAAGNHAGVTMRHILSALRLLPAGGRLVAITSEGFSPFSARYRPAFVALQKEASVRFSAGIDGKLFAKQGTTVDTRLTVMDRIPAENPETFANYHEKQASLSALLALVQEQVPARSCLGQSVIASTVSVTPAPMKEAPPQARSATGDEKATVMELEYFTRDWLGGETEMTTGLYQAYEPQTVVIPGAHPHPSPLVQSAAMASIAAPKPSYVPHLYKAVRDQGILSAAQLESVIYAGEAHAQYLKGYYCFDPKSGRVTRAADDQEGATQYRCGWYLGDGTGCGKGRQVAGILLDNWLKGRKRAVWISKNDKLLEDARRDWLALGGKESQVIPQWKYKLGEPIAFSEGILFTTYSTLRMPGKQGKCSRLEQLVQWLGASFDGCLIFDEAHAMANALAGKGGRGLKKPSAQGLAGVELQNALPHTRVVYVSATGATTVSNLAYATRLGLWGADDMPFASQEEFITAMEKGGIAAMEMISRDLKALGLYTARSLSYEGVEYEFLEHALTDEQIRIYDAYAEAFKVIHHNIEAALNATNINQENGKARNGMAKAAVRSAFEGNKQRFFNHLITAMKCPSLLKALRRDVENGYAAVVQIVSTSEALMERRLAEIPTSEWHDLTLDITPREYVLDYLCNAFPVHLHEIYRDKDGQETTRPARDAQGNPVVSRAAVAMRDALIEKLASLPAVPAALDQIIQHFGHEQVAEVTGRGRRIVRAVENGRDRLHVQNRPASANIAETHAFMDDRKQILVFSDAGGTGRSYHADKNAVNKRLRRHYLLEAGWKADSAIQGLGRTNRTNQEQPPVFIPVASDVKGEKRFLSTIARRLATLGAISKGQRETGGQGIFREEDNLESPYARAAFKELLRAIHEGNVPCCSLAAFEDATGLELADAQTGGLKENLPGIAQCLNRILALPIWLQNALFTEFDSRLTSRIEQAKETGAFETGVETLHSEGFTMLDRQALYTHPASGSETIWSRIERKDRTQILSLRNALAHITANNKAELAYNAASERVAVILPTNSLIREDGGVEERVQLIRPLSSSKMDRTVFADSGWQSVSLEEFSRLWQEEVDAAPEFTFSTFHLITGLLLPIWKKLPQNNVRVYRLQTTDAQQLLGRVVEPHEMDGMLENFGLAGSATPLSSQAILEQVVQRRKPYPLRNGLEIRAALVMGRTRIEVTGFSEAQQEILKALGCVSEIIQWTLRLFVPANDNAPQIIERLLAVA